VDSVNSGSSAIIVGKSPAAKQQNIFMFNKNKIFSSWVEICVAPCQVNGKLWNASGGVFLEGGGLFPVLIRNIITHREGHPAIKSY
jgi:hypothetical protein